MSIKIVPKNFNEAAKASIADVIACDESVIDSIIDAFSKHFTEMPEKLSKKVKEDGPSYKKVSAYNMWKKSKTEGDWKTMTDEENQKKMKEELEKIRFIIRFEKQMRESIR